MYSYFDALGEADPDSAAAAALSGYAVSVSANVRLEALPAKRRRYMLCRVPHLLPQDGNRYRKTG